MKPLAFLRSWLTPPVFEDDEEKTLLAQLLQPILLSMLLGAGVYALFAPVQPDRLRLAYAYCAVVGMTVVALLVVSRHGHVRAASGVLVAVLWLALTSAAVSSGGVLAAAYSGLMIVVLCAGVLLGKRAVLVTALLSVAAGAVLLLDPSPPPGALASVRRQAFLAHAVYILAAGALLSAVMRAMHQALARARREAVERQAALADLRKMQVGHEGLIRALETKNAELESFTYTVSHDLRSPLVTIKGFLTHVSEDVRAGDGERAEADIARIRGATEKMERLLADLLELSRVGQVLKPAAHAAFEDIVREALFLLQGRLAARGITVEVAPGLPRVWGDQTRLVQVVQNLLDNAIKFSADQAEPRIAVGWRPGTDESAPVFFVRDNGIGIASEHVERVFGLFRRLEPRFEGSGVGLALVRRIVERHGGRVWIESAGRGAGATFCFTLAAAPDAEARG